MNEKNKHSSLQEALKQVLYQNEMLLGWVQGAVITVDREGVVLTVNQIALQSLGYDEHELTGQHYHETFHHTLEDGTDYPWDFCPVFAAIEDGSSHHVTSDTFWKKDSTNFLVDYIVSPIRDENNSISGATLIFRNLTEQKLEEAKRIHGLKLESIGELSAGIAHEINTPIQFIGSNISFLKESFTDLFELIEEYQKVLKASCEKSSNQDNLDQIQDKEDIIDLEYLTDEIPKAIQQTITGVERVTKLVQGLKGFAHSTDSKEKSIVQINDIISDTLIVCKNAYKYVAKVELQLSEVREIPVFHSDIGQVLLNLVVNAAQAIEETNSGTDEMGTINIETREENDMVVMTVSDTGGGIPDEIANRVFDPFFTTKEVGRGSGQGLAIARNIVHDKHGGEMTFISDKGKGTIFTVKLPVG